MPLPVTVSCFSKIQIGFTFLVPADLGSPGKRAVKRVCALCGVRVCVLVLIGCGETRSANARLVLKTCIPVRQEVASSVGVRSTGVKARRWQTREL